jgi:hypothetical protein
MRFIADLDYVGREILKQPTILLLRLELSSSLNAHRDPLASCL